MVLPAEVAAAAAAAAEVTGNAPRKLTAASDWGVGVQQALCDKVQLFGRIKAAKAAGSSSKQPPPQQLSRQEMEQQLDDLLTRVQDWKRRYSSSTASSSSSSSSSTVAAASIPAGFELTPKEQKAAELAAAFLELVKASAAAKAAAATATKSKYIAKSAGLPSAKLGSGLETLLSAVNDDAARRLFLLHVGGPDGSSGFDSRRGGSSGSNGGSSDSSSDEEDDSSDEEDEDESAPGSVQAMLRAKARTAAAAEGTRKEGGAAAAGSRQAGAGAVGKDDAVSSASSVVDAAPRQLGGLDETLESLRETLEGAGDKQKQDQAGSAPSSSGSSSSSKQPAGKGGAAGDDDSSSSDSDSDSDESGLTFGELSGLLKKQMQELSTREGQNSDLALYLKASKGAYRVAASIPTAQDRVANALLLCFALLEQWAVAGAFVASSGNLAASFTAAAALQVMTTTLQQAVGQRERQRLRRDIGSGWALQLQMFGPGP
jgi:hypothetical protein